jgi:hypothetical protein
MYWKSVETGLYCRVVVDAGQSKVQCDQPSTATASQLTYTGHGATFNGQPLVDPYSSGTPGPLYFGNPGDPNQPLVFEPPPLPANTPINILGPTGNPVRNDNTSSAAYLGTGNGLSPAERYIAYDPTRPSSTTPIEAGQTAILKNLATGQFCRLMDITTSTPLKRPVTTSSSPQASSSPKPSAATTAKVARASPPATRRKRLSTLAKPAPPPTARTTSQVPKAAAAVVPRPPIKLRRRSKPPPVAAKAAAVKPKVSATRGLLSTRPAPDPALQLMAALRRAPSSKPRLTARLSQASASKFGMVCDQPSAATATAMTYTGNGLAYNGTPLVAAAPGQPLLLSNTTSAPANTLTFPPSKPGKHCC